MAINAARPRAMTDGSQTGIVDTSMAVTHGDLLKYDSTKKMYVPTSTSIFSLSDFVNDLNIISLADVNSAIDSHAIASSGNGTIELSSYVTDAEVQQLFTDYVPVIDYVNVTNTPSLASFATSSYVDQQIAGLSSSFSGDYADLINQPSIPSIYGLSTVAYVDQQIANIGGGVNLSGYVSDEDLAIAIAAISHPSSNAFSGNYDDLINLPSIFSGDYNNLTNQPSGLSTVAYVDQQIASVVSGGSIDLSGYVTETELTTAIAAIAPNTIAFSGNYADLINQPVIFSGDYNDLTNQPIIPSVTGLATETFVTDAVASASLASVASLNDLNDVAVDGTETITHVIMYNSLSSMWENVDLTELWASKQYVTEQLIGLQTNGVINLVGYASEIWVTQQLAERGDHFSGNYTDLSNLPTLFSGDYNDLANIPSVAESGLSFTLVDNLLSLSNGNDINLDNLALNYNTLTNVPVEFSGNYADLTNLPNLFSGNAADLINQPHIPSIVGLASEVYVNNKWSEPVTHDIEFRADIKQIASSVSTIAQKRDLVFAIETTDAVSTEVSFSDGTYITLSDNTTAKFTATYVATNGTVHDSFTVSGIVHKMNGTLVAIGNNNYEVTQDSNSGFTGEVSVDSVNDRMTVTVQGAVGIIVDWVVFVELTEVTR